MRSRVSLLMGALSLVALACGDNGNGPGNGHVDQGSFTATVSGDLGLSVSGEAVFGIQTQGASSAFVIALMHGTYGGDNSDFVFIGRDNTTAPGVGTFVIQPASCISCTADDFTGAYLHQVGIADYGIFFSDTGAFTITAASADTLQGTFEFSGSLFIGIGSIADADSVRLQGSFTAVAGEVPGAP